MMKALWERVKASLKEAWYRDNRAHKPKPLKPTSPVLEEHVPASRSRIFSVLFVFGVLIVLGRAFYLQWINTDFYQGKGESIYARTKVVPAKRGEIHDRNGSVLASTLPTADIYFDPQELAPEERFRLKELARVMGIPYAKLDEKIQKRKSRNYVLLARQQSLAMAQAVRELKIPGIGFHEQELRQYPHAEVFAHVVGVTGRSGNGQEGVELAKNDLLSGTPGKRDVVVGGGGQIISEKSFTPSIDGGTVTLSLDSRIQFVAYRAITEAVKTFDAKAGAVLVADVTNGEIVALASVPTYNPNDRTTLDFERMRNRVIVDQFEPGSTMKPFAVAKALDMKLITPLTTIQTGPGKLTILDRTIGDTSNHGVITVAEVISMSSNIGTAKIALEIPSEELYKTYEALGFGKAPKTDFPGAASGRIRPWNTWRPIEQATISYGHGMTASLFQLVRAYTALARQGDVIDLTLFKRDDNAPVEGTPVFTPETTLKIRAMMRETVRKGGTASAIHVAGYSVAGKTGTANKVKNGKYTNDLVSSFVGIVPATNPKFIVAVMLDEPTKGRYGGRVSADVFNQVALNALRIYHIPHDDKDDMNNQTLFTKKGSTR